MLAYAASADVINGTSPEEIHSRVYAELRDRTSPETYQRIIAGNHYRQVMHKDADAFNEQLPYYSRRVTFNALLEAINDFGVSFYDAGYWVTALAFILAFLVLWGSLNDRIHPLLQLMFPLVFLKYSMDLEIIRQILADSLSSLWVVLICIAYFRETRLLLPLIALSVFVRVDLVIFSGLLLLMLFVSSDRKKYPALFACGIALVAAFFFVQRWAGSYGWQTLYYFAIISDMLATHPSQYGSIGFTLSDYLNSLADTSRWISPMYGITALFSVMTLLVWRFAKLGEYNLKVCRITLVCVLYIVVHYLVFPQMYLRFFVGQNMMIFAGFSVLCTHLWHVYVDDRRQNIRLDSLQSKADEISNSKY